MTDCFKCIYREKGITAHSSCKHPKTESAYKDPHISTIAAIAGIYKEPLISAIAEELNIRANQYGINNGWFNWPWDFAPVWLENCDGFISKDGDNNNETTIRSDKEDGQETQVE